MRRDAAASPMSGVNVLRRFVHRDHDRRRQAALPGAAERGVGDDARGHRHVRVRQDHDRVLGPALRLRALAVGGRAAVDVLRDRRRADERDGAHVRVIEQRVHRALAAVHQVDDAGREPGLIDQLHDAAHRHRRPLGRLEDDRVAARHGVGHEPQRDHRREVERRDRRHDADRLADHQLVDARGDVLEVVAHHHRGDAGGHLDVLEAALQLTLRLADGLAAFLGDDLRQLVPVLLEQELQLEQRLDAVAGRHAAPFLVGRAGGRHRLADRRRVGERRLGDDRAGGRVEDGRGLGHARALPMAADVVQESSLVDHEWFLEIEFRVRRQKAEGRRPAGTAVPCLTFCLVPCAFCLMR